MQASKKDFEHVGRLKKRSDFLRVQFKGQKWISKSLILQCVENGDDRIRFGITVSKKASKKAVVRNRIKRRLRSAALEVVSSEAKKGYDFVLIGRTDTFDRPYPLLKKDLLWCLERLNAGTKKNS
jgi:ribonuclease P protein component